MPFLHLKSPITCLSISVSVHSASDRGTEGGASHPVPGHRSAAAHGLVRQGNRRKVLHSCISEGMEPELLMTACVSLGTGRSSHFLVAWNQAAWLQWRSLPALFVHSLSPRNSAAPLGWLIPSVPHPRLHPALPEHLQELKLRGGGQAPASAFDLEFSFTNLRRIFIPSISAFANGVMIIDTYAVLRFKWN